MKPKFLPAWIVAALSVIWPLSAPAALKDILQFEDKMEKSYDMSGKIYDTQSLQRVKNYDGLKEFRTTPRNDMPTFGLPAENKGFNKSFRVSESRVFNGRSYLDASQSYRTGPATGFSGNYSTRNAAGFDTGANPMGDKTYKPARERYEGPELTRKTTEIEIINQTLQNKKDLKGGVLSMSEVREILNKRE
ncbi:MAG: hypothetical protein SFU85_03230 [Candidatus Methylacidiphilales bacterium]|nr:hypothetical protein [Candidatus Methylacidiphilales bacterium]